MSYNFCDICDKTKFQISKRGVMRLPPNFKSSGHILDDTAIFVIFVMKNGAHNQSVPYTFFEDDFIKMVGNNSGQTFFMLYFGNVVPDK